MEELKNLEKQLKDIDLKIEKLKTEKLINKPIKEIKMFITYKGNIFKTIDKILFDTIGIYSHLVEAKDEHNWKIDNVPSFLWGKITNSKQYFNFELYKNLKCEMKISGLDITEIVGKIYESNKIIVNIMKTKNKAYLIQYNSTILNCDDVINIMDQLIKMYKKFFMGSLFNFTEQIPYIHNDSW